MACAVQAGFQQGFWEYVLPPVHVCIENSDTRWLSLEVPGPLCASPCPTLSNSAKQQAAVPYWPGVTQWKH